MYGGAPWGAQKASVPEKLLRGALSGPGAPRPVRAGATPPSPYALRTSPRAAATTGGRLPRLPAQLRPRSVRSSQDAETLRSSPQATVAIGAASVGAQTESQRVPGLIRRRPAGQPVIMRACICLCGCASGMRLLWAECRLGRAPGQGVVCRGLRGQPLAANSLGGGVERRCGTWPARAKLNCGLEHAQAGCRTRRTASPASRSLGETEQGETEQTDAAPAVGCHGSAGDWSAARKERALSTALETPGHDKP